MKKISFENRENSTVINAANGKVSAEFVKEIKDAFLKFPKKANMRYKQSLDGRLIISLTVTYDNGISQHLEGAGDADLISAILLAMGRIIKGLSEYKAEEHEVEIAAKDEDLVMEIFKQYMNSNKRSYIENDWFSDKGERYRCVTFTPSFNMKVKFSLKATEEVNNLISEACKPEWMKKSEAEAKAKQEVPEKQESEVA